MSRHKSAQHSRDGLLQSETATLLEYLHGLCLGAQPGNCSVLSPIVVPLLRLIVSLLDIYCSAAEIIEVVLKTFVAAAEVMLLYIGDVSRNNIIWFGCLE